MLCGGLNDLGYRCVHSEISDNPFKFSCSLKFQPLVARSCHLFAEVETKMSFMEGDSIASSRTKKVVRKISDKMVNTAEPIEKKDCLL
jgi:hypothetical protein